MFETPQANHLIKSTRVSPHLKFATFQMAARRAIIYLLFRICYLDFFFLLAYLNFSEKANPLLPLLKKSFKLHNNLFPNQSTAC